MKFSNRVLGILILLGLLITFYIFYQIFFKIKLTKLEINSNIGNFSGSLENIKYSKDFYCEEKKCIINDIPKFVYKLKIDKKGYKEYQTNLDLSKMSKLDIYLEKKVVLEKIEKKKISNREKILELNKNKLDFGNKKINYNKIFGEDNFVYFKYENGNKLYFYNLNNNNLFDIIFKPKINYIKKLTNKKFLINSEVGSFIFDSLNKNIEYFSLFSDFILYENNYIGIINSDDITRKKNFDLEGKSGNFIIFYNKKTKDNYILKNLNNKISSIYIFNDKIYIEDIKGNKFELKGLLVL